MVGHVAVGAKEHLWAHGDVDLAETGGDHAGPRAWIFDEPSGDGIGYHVRELVEDVVGVIEPNVARLLGGPEILDSTEGGVDRAGDESVHELQELGEAGVGIRHDAVPVIGHLDEGVNLDASAISGVGKAVEEDRVRVVGWAEQELALGAAPGDEGRWRPVRGDEAWTCARREHDPRRLEPVDVTAGRRQPQVAPPWRVAPPAMFQVARGDHPPAPSSPAFPPSLLERPG